MKILLTHFDPFGGQSLNAAQEAVRAVERPDGVAELIKLEIPTQFDACMDVLSRAMQAHHPDAIVCVGEAAGRAPVTVERVAINVIDARIPDNAGSQPVDQPIAPDGPAAYFSTLPLRAIVERIRARGIPAEISNSAGTFVCNRLFYGEMHAIATGELPIRAGFIHVPCLPQQLAPGSNSPSMARETTAQALEAALEAIANA